MNFNAFQSHFTAIYLYFHHMANRRGKIIAQILANPLLPTTLKER